MAYCFFGKEASGVRFPVLAPCRGDTCHIHETPKIGAVFVASAVEILQVVFVKSVGRYLVREAQEKS